MMITLSNVESLPTQTVKVSGQQMLSNLTALVMVAERYAYPATPEALYIAEQARSDATTYISFLRERLQALDYRLQRLPPLTSTIAEEAVPMRFEKVIEDEEHQ